MQAAQRNEREPGAAAESASSADSYDSADSAPIAIRKASGARGTGGADGAGKNAAQNRAGSGDPAHVKKSADHAGGSKSRDAGSAKAASGKQSSAKRKSAGRKRRSFVQLLKESWFYRIYFLLLLICAVALVLGLAQLWAIAAEYEETQPIHSAEPYLALFEQRDWNALQAIDASAEALRYDDEGQYAQQLDALLGEGEYSLRSIVTIDERERQYNLLLDGSKIGELTLEQSGETTKHGMARWQLKRLETQLLATREYSITVPSDSAVTVNGKPLGETDIIERDISVVDSSNLPDGVPAPTLVRYGVSMMSLQAGDIAVTDRNGAAAVPEQDGEYGFRCDLAWDDERIKAQVEEEVVKWGRRIAAYTSYDYNKIDLANACINPSPARTYIRNMENQWAPIHHGYDFGNMETGEYYIYADNCFSCRISFDYILHFTSEDRSYPTQYTLYFAKDGSRFKLYSFTIDAAQDAAEQQ